ncbi:MAG: LytTR family transcriptional regulator, partial [Gammaproteobacteria bacterium]|nr:LytTR family transcriptional regulator [Gammaproteobacteria bacterium]
FRFISDTISPFLGMEHTRYGVFAFFFVFWSALDLALYSLILAYAHSSWFYQRQLSGQQRLAELELELNQAINTSKPHEHLEYFTVRKTSKRHVIPAREVQWIEADGYYAKLHTAEGGYLLRESLNTLDAQLDSKLFVRVHRSTIVNTGYIKEFGPDNNGAWTIALTGGVIRRVSRSGRQRLESRFK